jgi:hypothetical protein
MKSPKEIEKFIRNTDIHSNPDVNRAVLKNLIKQFDATEQEHEEPVSPANKRRIIMKSPMIKYAAAVVTIVAMLIGINQFGGPMDATASTFAAMQKAVERMPVMRQEYWTNFGSGSKHHTEKWYDFKSRTVISSYSKDGKTYKISSLNYDTMKNMVYDPESKVVEIVYRSDVFPKAYPDSAAELVDEYLKNYEFRGAKIRQQRVLFNGKDADIFLLTIESNERRNTESTKLVVNRGTHLPMAWEKRAVTPNGDITFEQSMRFYFPTEAPKDIYGIGVPRSSKVIVDSVSEKRYKQKVDLLERIPNLEKSFSEIYRLADKDILMWIRPEDVHRRWELEQTEKQIHALQEEQYLERLAKENASNNAVSNKKVPLRTLSPSTGDQKGLQKYYTVFEWNDGIDRRTSRAIFFEGASVREVLERIIGLSKFDYDIPDEILDIVIPGDWIIRTGAQTDQLLSSFNEVFCSYTKQPMYFHKRRVQRDVIVARGRFKFKPLSVTYDNSWIHIFSDELDKNEGGGGWLSKSLDRFLRQRLAVEHLGRQIVNLAESTDKARYNFGTHLSSYLKKLPPGPEKENKVRKLLENLSQQTGLTFSRERRAVDVWYVEKLKE